MSALLPITLGFLCVATSASAASYFLADKMVTSGVAVEKRTTKRGGSSGYNITTGSKALTEAGLSSPEASATVGFEKLDFSLPSLPEEESQLVLEAKAVSR
jgi:hypothetical protein